MTGYGRAVRELDGRELSVELKSVNHRFLDLSFRMPRSFSFLEDDARRRISGTLARGHVEIYITYKNRRADAKAVELDQALLSAYMRALDSAVGLPDDRTLMSVLRFPDVLTIKEAEEDQDALRALAAETLEMALLALTQMRAREGEELRRDIAKQVDALERITCQIEERYPLTVGEYAKRLRASIEELIGQNVDQTRLLTEVAIMADKSAIDEETVRLKSHIGLLRECLESEEPVGRRIDFVVQELNREVNTISSKSQDIPITNLVVEGKAVIEKLREQVQNVE
jgi:uncharacterized protein (TIGR00255 family)